MIVLGLTGSIGMGKSSASQMLKRLRVPVHDADAVVRGLMATGGKAVTAIAAVFPEAASGSEGIDRHRLGAVAFTDEIRLKKLEVILHPLVRKAERSFLHASARRRERLAVLDIPLLYETGGEKRVDGVIVVTAPPHLQALRVLARPGMTQPRFNAILVRQVPDMIKRRRADWVIQTGLGYRPALRTLLKIIRQPRYRSPCRSYWRPGC